MKNNMHILCLINDFFILLFLCTSALFIFRWCYTYNYILLLGTYQMKHNNFYKVVQNHKDLIWTFSFAGFLQICFHYCCIITYITSWNSHLIDSLGYTYSQTKTLIMRVILFNKLNKSHHALQHSCLRDLWAT